MDTLTAPIIPGLTEGAQGKPEQETLYNLVMMRRANRKRYEQFMNIATKMFIPREPPPDPLVQGLQPPSQVGLPPLGQLMGPPGAY